MSNDKKTIKKPMSEQGIYKNMMIAVLSVSALFFVKNILSQAWTGAIVIGVCLGVFSLLTFLMKKKEVKLETQQLVICLSIILLVFCISLNSGAFYSDDFPLYLAVIALSGLYLVPKYTLIQVTLIDISCLLYSSGKSGSFFSIYDVYCNFDYMRFLFLYGNQTRPRFY